MKLLELLELPLPNLVSFCDHPRPCLLDRALLPASLGEQPQGGFKLWNDFADKVLSHKQQLGDGESDSFTPPPAAPRGGHVVVEETGTRCLLYVYWAKTIEEMSQELLRRGVVTETCEFFWSEEQMKKGMPLLGWPDHVLHAGNRVKVIIEARTPKVLITGSDLFSSTDPQVQVVLQQMYAYLRVNSHYGFAGAYGIISSFESTWFCKLEGDSLLVSEPIQVSGSCSRPGIYAALWYFLHLALTDPDQKLAPSVASAAAGRDALSTFLKRVCMVASADEKELLDHYESYDLQSVEIHSCIGRFESSSVFRASVNKQPLVLKVLDMSQKPQEMLRYHKELQTYAKLSAIQGDSIPELVCCGFLTGALFFIGLSDAGDDLEMVASRNGGEIPANIARDAIDSLDIIHRRRMSHRDLRLSNACCEYLENDEVRVRWVNLYRARSTYKEREELTELATLLKYTLEPRSPLVYDDERRHDEEVYDEEAYDENEVT